MSSRRRWPASLLRQQSAGGDAAGFVEPARRDAFASCSDAGVFVAAEEGVADQVDAYDRSVR